MPGTEEEVAEALARGDHDAATTAAIRGYGPEILGPPRVPPPGSRSRERGVQRVRGATLVVAPAIRSFVRLLRALSEVRLAEVIRAHPEGFVTD